MNSGPATSAEISRGTAMARARAPWTSATRRPSRARTSGSRIGARRAGCGSSAAPAGTRALATPLSGGGPCRLRRGTGSAGPPPRQPLPRPSPPPRLRRPGGIPDAVRSTWAPRYSLTSWLVYRSCESNTSGERLRGSKCALPGSWRVASGCRAGYAARCTIVGPSPLVLFWISRLDSVRLRVF